MPEKHPQVNREAFPKLMINDLRANLRLHFWNRFAYEYLGAKPVTSDWIRALVPHLALAHSASWHRSLRWTMR